MYVLLCIWMSEPTKDFQASSVISTTTQRQSCHLKRKYYDIRRGLCPTQEPEHGDKASQIQRPASRVDHVGQREFQAEAVIKPCSWSLRTPHHLIEEFPSTLHVHGSTLETGQKCEQIMRGSRFSLERMIIKIIK